MSEQVAMGIFAAAFLIVGPSLLSVGLWKLCRHLHKRLRCTVRTEGEVVAFVPGKWKKPVKRGVRHIYYTRWFPVYEYNAEGQRIRRKSKIPVLALQEPEKGAESLRYDPRFPERFYIPGEFTKMDWIVIGMLLYVGGGFTAFLVYGVIGWLTA